MSHPRAPELDNQYRSDRVLQTWLQQHLPVAVREAIEADLDALGAQAVQAWQDARSRTPQPAPAGAYASSAAKAA